MARRLEAMARQGASVGPVGQRRGGLKRWLDGELRWVL
jgi:hypothetical protein